MPELPEVEVTRRSIAARLQGARVMSARCGKPLRWPLGIAPEMLVGSRLGEVQRRGKYLSLALHDAAGEPGPHVHFDLGTTQGLLRLTDPRRFGAVLWSPGIDQAPAAGLLARLGAEPFDPAFTAQALHAACRRRKVSIKSLLLGGQVVVGAGNIYACEALFRAGIDPRSRCDRLSLPRCARLLAALRETLGRALELGGSTLRDFSDAHGVAGEFQAEARVYGRDGQDCLRCASPVRRIVQAQRSTYFCPACQKRA
jgi:formamidopyrimidine-DNA glycosylase